MYNLLIIILIEATLETMIALKLNSNVSDQVDNLY
jgi:hypothetical protein